MSRLMFRKVKGKISTDDLSETDKARLAMALDSDGSLFAADANGYFYPVFSFSAASKLSLKLVELYGGIISQGYDKRYPQSRTYP